MNIVGINYYFHDSSACVVRDGELIVAVEEERFSRRKHTTRFPATAIERCLEFANLDARAIDRIAVSINPTKNLMRKLSHAAALATSAGPFLKHELVAGFRKQRAFWAWYRQRFANGRRPRVDFVNHHDSHVLGSYLVSPYEDAALLSLDGSGEWSTSWVGAARGLEFECFSESYFPHSLGSFYESATEFCGFRPNYDEGKTMGLAPFGDASRFYDEVSRIVEVDDSGRIEIDLSFFRYQNAGPRRCSDKFYRIFGQPRGKDDPIEDHHSDVAAAFQRVLEERALGICRALRERTGARHLVVAGGVALNSVMNGRILREAGFDDLYVMPAAGDNGTSIGAAYYVHHIVAGNVERHVHDNPFVGIGYDSSQVESELKACKLPYRKSDNVCRDAAELLRDQKIIGWFQGRAEIGPRALGGRSILADPTNTGMKAKINSEVKHRESYRPFAPSAPADDKDSYFEIDVEAPFMLKVCAVRPEQRERLPAITHVDGSARLQTVTENANPRYYRLLKEFGRLSGVPVLLNTSFNVMGEPIVQSPQDAIRCFYSTGLDTLVIDDFIVSK